MHITSSLLQLGAFASTVSAFYPYVPDYKCIEDGNCADTSKRGLSNELVEALQEKGSFEVNIKQRKPQTTHTERISRYIEHLIRRFEKRESSYSITPSAATTLPHSAPIGQDGRDFSYMTTMKFGSAGQEMNMLIDTGASTTWVMGSDCTDEACTHHNLFKQEDSTSLTKISKGLSLVYGTGKVSLTMAKDTVEVAGFKLPMTFGVGHTVTDTFMSYPMDGILGLAYKPDADPQSFLGALMDGGLLKDAIFGVNLHRGADGTNDGSIVFGAVDNSKFSGDITYGALHASHNGSWMITSGEAGFDGKKAGLAGKKVIIDSGTSYCFLPPDDAKKFYSTFPDAELAANGESYTVPCDTTTPAQFTFDGVTYEVSAKDWVGGSLKDGGRCTSNIYSRDATGSSPENKLNAWLMGDTFLKNVYTVFDVGQSRIGFAKKATSSSSSTSSSVTSSATGTTILSSLYKIPSRYSTTSLGKDSPLMTNTEDLRTTSVAELSSSSSSSDLPSSSEAPTDASSTPLSASTASETSTRTTEPEPDLIATTDTSSSSATSSSVSSPTGTDFTGFNAPASDAATTPEGAAAPAETAPSNSGAASFSSSFALFASAILASLAIAI